MRRLDRMTDLSSEERKRLVDELTAKRVRVKMEAVAASNSGDAKHGAELARQAEEITREINDLARTRLDENTPVARFSAVRAMDGNERGHWGSEALDFARAIFQRDYHGFRVQQDGDGGYTVVTEVHSKFVQDLRAQAAIRKAGAPVLRTHSDSLAFSKLSDVDAVWAAEVPATTESTNPDVQQVVAQIKKLRTLWKCSEQLAHDSESDVLSELTEYAADKIAEAEDDGLINGDGIGVNPLGLLNSADLPATIDVDGTTANSLSNTIADRGSAAKIITLAGELPSRFHDGAHWLMHGSSFAAIRALVDAEGRPYFPETFAGMNLIGYPVILADAVPEDGTNLNKCLIFGNFRKGYRLVEKPQGLSIRVLTEKYADSDELGLRIIWRVGGAMVIPQAFRVGVV
jgi:HK97 family phage major capsid protein